MSPGHDQDYFSDGLSEELLNQLAQIKELRVTGRTSSFSFKGKNEDLRVIGEKLGVSNLLEGSVRKDGNHLRITAQLINAKDGTHLWSQTFDRELSGVFAVQEEIAMAVSGALSITLDVGAMSREKGGTTNVEAYDKFLKARTLFLQGGKDEYVRSAQLYRDAVALDPAFARAWLGLYQVLWGTVDWMPETAVAARKEQDEASAHIIALAPNAWWTQVMRADRFDLQHKWSEEEAAARAALAAAPASEPDALAAYLNFLVDVGRVKEAVAYAERLREADPLSLSASSDLQQLLDMAGQPAEAQAEYERSKALAGNHGEVEHIALFRLMNRKDADPATVKARFREFLSHETVPMALNHVLLDKLENKEAARAAIRQAFDDPANQDGTRMLIIEGYADSFGDRDLALAALRRVMFDFDNGSPWYPYVTNLRTDSRFKDLVRDLGLVDYWRTTGNWGDFCKPVGKDDFECH
jgi:TolB-like protein